MRASAITPADVYFGRRDIITPERERINARPSDYAACFIENRLPKMKT
jgi:hypothetical protein